MLSPIRQKRGFTLIEVMVVCATIALVLMILAPAIREGRERANTLRCRNNLKMLGLAIHNYESTFSSLPPGYVVAIKTPPKDGARQLEWNLGWGWQAEILPYCDQAPVYNQLDFQLGLPTEVGNVATAKIFSFRCPEDSGSAIVSKVTVLGPLHKDRATKVVEKGFARSNYVGLAGWDNDWHLGTSAKENPNGPADASASNWSKLELGKDFRDGIAVYAGSLTLKDKTPCPNVRDYHGCFGENSHRKFSEMKDGTSNIFVIGERATPTKNTDEKDVGNVIWAGVPNRSTRVGQSLSLGSAYWPINHEMKNDAVPNSTGFNSRHTGGANFLAMDGVVRTVSEKMDLSLLRRLSIVDDGVKGEIEIPPAQ